MLTLSMSLFNARDFVQHWPMAFSVIFTAANKVWGKVIFLHLFVILFTGGGLVPGGACSRGDLVLGGGLVPGGACSWGGCLLPGRCGPGGA